MEVQEQMFCNVTLGQIQKTEKKYFWFDLSAFVSEEEEEGEKRGLIEQGHPSFM